MDALNRIALLIHEFIYASFRLDEERELFKKRFYVYGAINDCGYPEIEIVFNVIEGRHTLVRTSARFLGLSIEKLISNQVIGPHETKLLVDSYPLDGRWIRFDFRPNGPHQLFVFSMVGLPGETLNFGCYKEPAGSPLGVSTF